RSFEALDTRLQDLGRGRPTGDGERATFRQALQEAKRQRQELEHPITVEMFNRLKERLERIPTATQREGRR
ncbi:MAG TPA: hypothetical protein VMY37_26620, partial [Thermoguttaceae bacterium]|nr:hypothetical protein [Thermoguttaceae bacterium]